MQRSGGFQAASGFLSHERRLAPSQCLQAIRRSGEKPPNMLAKKLGWPVCRKAFKHARQEAWVASCVQAAHETAAETPVCMAVWMAVLTAISTGGGTDGPLDAPGERAVHTPLGHPDSRPDGHLEIRPDINQEGNPCKIFVTRGSDSDG